MWKALKLVTSIACSRPTRRSVAHLEAKQELQTTDTGTLLSCRIPDAAGVSFDQFCHGVSSKHSFRGGFGLLGAALNTVMEVPLEVTCPSSRNLSHSHDTDAPQNARYFQTVPCMAACVARSACAFTFIHLTARTRHYFSVVVVLTSWHTDNSFGTCIPHHSTKGRIAERKAGQRA